MAPEHPHKGEAPRQLANSKGFMVWNALSLEVGRDLFRRILSGVTRRHSTSRITWEEVLRQVTEGANRDLSWFYSQWFDRTGVPEWRIEPVTSGTAGGAMLVQILPAYRASVRVDMYGATCPRSTHSVRIDGERTPLPKPDLKCGEVTYVVDPDFEIIHWTPELKAEYGKGSER